MKEPRRSSRRGAKKKQDPDFAYGSEEEEDVVGLRCRVAIKTEVHVSRVHVKQGEGTSGGGAAVVKQEVQLQQQQDMMVAAPMKVEGSAAGYSAAYEGKGKGKMRARHSEEDEEWEEDGEDKRKNKKKKQAAPKNEHKGKNGKVPAGEAYGILTGQALENLPSPLLDGVLDLVVDTHELRSFVSVAHDLLALRVTCKTILQAVTPLMPELEAGLLKEGDGFFSSSKWPLKLSIGTFPFYTAELHALLGEPVSMSDNDARLAHKFFRLRGSGTLSDIRKSLKACRPPRPFGLSPLARSSIRNIKGDRLCKKVSKSEYSLRDADFDALPQMLVDNPVDVRFKSMRMVEVWRLKEASLKRHKSVVGLHRFQNKCVQVHSRAQRTREDRQGMRTQEIKEAVSSRDLHLNVSFYFDEYVQHKDGSVHGLIHRAYDLATALSQPGAPLTLAGKSHLARAYIDSNASARRRHKNYVAKMQRKAVQKDKTSKGASSTSATQATASAVAAAKISALPPLPPLPQIVATITEAAFFERYTDFLRQYEGAVRPFKDMDDGGSDYGDYGYDAYDFYDGFGFMGSYSGGGRSQKFYEDDGDYDPDPVAVPNASRTALEMRDDKWAAAMTGAQQGVRPLFKTYRDKALREWMLARNLKTREQVVACGALPASLKELAATLI